MRCWAGGFEEGVGCVFRLGGSVDVLFRVLLY